MTELLAYYKFDNNQNDSSGNSNTLTNNGSISFSNTNKKVGTHSIQYANGSFSSVTHADLGLHQYVTDFDGTTYNSSLLGFSISLWFNANTNTVSVNNNLYLFSQGTNTEIDKTLHIFWAANQTIKFNFYNFSGNDITTGVIDKTNDWIHFVFTCNGGGHRRIYKDGDELSTNEDFTNNNKLLENSDNPSKVFINKKSFGSGGSKACMYDDYRIYKGVLTQTQINTLYSNSTPTITGVSINDNNTQLTVTFSEDVYDTNLGSGILEVGDFNLHITGGSASLSSVNPSSISKTSDSEWVLGIPLSGTPNGSETLSVVPSDTAIFNFAGKAASTSQSNNTINLNSNLFSLVNTLGGNKLQATKTYTITFTVTSSVTMKFGGSNNTTGLSTADEYFNTDAVYNAGTHTVNVTPTQNWDYLWATVSSGNDTDITSMTCRQSSVSYEPAFDSDNSRFIMEMILSPTD